MRTFTHNIQLGLFFIFQLGLQYRYKVLEPYFIFLISIKSIDNVIVLTKLNLSMELPPDILLSQVAMVIDLIKFFIKYFCTYSLKLSLLLLRQIN
jgi:hypothetical protein